MAWVCALQTALLPFSLKGVYTNFLGDEGEEQVRASYGVNYERLVALKNTYDPGNVFHFNQNIPPTRGVNHTRAVPSELSSVSMKSKLTECANTKVSV
jgi:hypothetical protein